MGTRLEVHLEGEDPASLADASQAVLREIGRIEQACSTWIPESTWSRFNQAEGRPVQLGREWTALLAKTLEWHRRTGGAFDPVLGRLVEVWGLRRGAREPASPTLVRAKEASGGALLELDVGRGTAHLKHPAAALEEGGFVKGYALDRARAGAEEAGAKAGWLDFGGQLLVWGRGREVGVASPEDRSSERLRVWVENASVSTSGSSERGRHHLDPRTGRLCADWGSVSVVAYDGLTADVLSTALYVMGPQEGRRWADAEKVAAVFFTRAGDVLSTRAFRDLREPPTRAGRRVGSVTQRARRGLWPPLERAPGGARVERTQTVETNPRGKP